MIDRIWKERKPRCESLAFQFPPYLTVWARNDDYASNYQPYNYAHYDPPNNDPEKGIAKVTLNVNSYPLQKRHKQCSKTNHAQMTLPAFLLTIPSLRAGGIGERISMGMITE